MINHWRSCYRLSDERHGALYISLFIDLHAEVLRDIGTRYHVGADNPGTLG